MKVGILGLGKLGLALAEVIQQKHDVLGYDPMRCPDTVPFSSIREIAQDSDLVLVIVQTPHEPLYDGTHELPDTRADFDYHYLVRACQEIADVRSSVPVAIVSTVLPGTCDRLIRPLLQRFAYSPSFTAMGTVEHDFLNPEFALIGTERLDMQDLLTTFYSSFHDAPIVRADVVTAELIKMAYNVAIGQKVVFANAMMELCHWLGADVDTVTSTLKQATNRIVSPAYMDAGMGDSGPCHPRDQIAMSYLARSLNLSYDIFSSVIEAREEQTYWLASLVLDEAKDASLPVAVLGHSYKPNSPLPDGSSSILLQRFLEKDESIAVYDPIAGVGDKSVLRIPSVFVIATKHPEFATCTFPAGSVVVDPFGYIADQEGVTVKRVGRR